MKRGKHHMAELIFSAKILRNSIGASTHLKNAEQIYTSPA